MGLIKWDTSLSVNVEEIDNQHKKLLEILNKLYENIKNKNSDNILKETLEELTKFTNYHFKTEEKYFDEFNYKLKDQHKKEHKKFIKKIKDFKEEYGDNTTLDLEIVSFLISWIKDHMGITDQKFTKCFNENGLF
jgi:hemerythrin